MLLPGLAKTGARLKTVADLAGLPAAHLGRKYGFETAASEASTVLDDPEINTVFIATRHDSHAPLVLRALEAGKNVWVEKPLCLTLDELAAIEALEHSAPLLMVGFNRRFAPQVVRIHELLASVRGPKAMVMTVNAGAIPADHWIHHPEIGGGRIVGEGCHFIDLLRFLAGAPLETVSAVPAPPGGATITLSFAGGSTGTVHYLTGGNKSFPKERLTVFCGGRVLELANFIRLTGHGWPRFRKMNLWRQDKGNHAAVAAFIAAVQSGSPSPIAFSELIEVTRATWTAGFSRRGASAPL
jgi:predicted dehydrogenase